MQNNFFIETTQHHNDLYLTLNGIFDGSSAFELIQTIKNEEYINKFVFIDTTNLTSAIPFGKAILDTHLPKNKNRAKIHFKGSHAKSIIPEGCTLLKGKTPKKHVCKGTCKNCKCKSNANDTRKLAYGVI